MKKSKRYLEARSRVDKKKLYKAKECLSLIKDIANNEKAKVKFDQSVEIAINLNLRAKHTVRDTLMFPHSISKIEKKNSCFCKG